MASDNLQAKLDDIFREQADLYNSAGQDLAAQLQVATAAALALLAQYLHDKLALDEKNRVRRTRENLVILRKLPRLLAQLLRKYGFHQSIRTYVNEFPEQLPILASVFAVQAQAVGRSSLTRGPLLVASDLDLLHLQQRAAIASLDASIATLGGRITQTLLQGVGRLSLPDAQVAISRELERNSKGVLVTGEAAMANFYRLANGQVFDRVQGQRATPLLYRYAGPLDILNRKFCRRMETGARNGETWTKAQLVAMRNDMPAPWDVVWENCGGIHCRHQILVLV